MSTTLNDTIDAAKDTLESAKESAKEGTQHAVSSVRSTLMEGLQAVNGVVSIIRHIQFADPLAWFGLTRKRGPLGSIALFGAGVVVGAGAGMLFAPMSGADTRRMIFGRFMAIEKKAEAGAKEIEGTLENKAGDLAGKAKDAVTSAERKVETFATKAKDTVTTKTEDLATKAKDAVTTKTEDLATRAKDVLTNVERKADDLANKAKDDANSALSSSDLYRKDKTESMGGNQRSTHARHS